MSEGKRGFQVQGDQLNELFSRPIVPGDKEKALLAELVRGAEVCFGNAEQLFQEASLLREHRHFSRSIFLHQIAMEECAKVDMIGAAATGLMLGLPVDTDALGKAFRDHKAKNFTNAYLAAASEGEIAAREANDKEAWIDAFKNKQREIHGFLNMAKNASMYVDFTDGEFVAPDDVVSEELASLIAGISYYFMEATYPRLRSLRRMLNEPNLHFEMMAGIGEVMQKALASQGTMEEMDAAFGLYLKELAATIVARRKKDPTALD